MIFHNIKNGIRLDAYANLDPEAGQIWFDGTNFKFYDNSELDFYADPLTTIGDILYKDGLNETTRLGVGADGYILTVTSGIPTWKPDLQIEVNSIEDSIGDSIDGYGQWVGFSGSFALDLSSTLTNALEILDDGYEFLKNKVDQQDISLNNIQTEIDTIEGSIGSSIDGDGQWLGFSGTNLLNSSLTLTDALEILDDGYQSLKTELSEQSVSVVSINSNITLLKGKTYLVDTTAARTLTLPAPILNGYVAIKDKSGSSATNNITLNTSSGFIDGSVSKTLAKNYGAWALVSDGTDWYFTVSSTTIYGV
jgi:hypothetical protein